MIYLISKENNLIPIKSENVQWLDKATNYELARYYWQERGQVLSFNTWNKAHEFGYQYAGIVEHGKIVSLAGIWCFSEKIWEIAAVSTLESYRKRGYARRIFAFLTTYIHESGCVATCSTSGDNTAMIALAESVGFQQVPESEIWWSYPRLPDF